MPFGYLTALALTFIFSFALGVFTLLIHPRSRVHQLWFFTTMGVRYGSVVKSIVKKGTWKKGT